MCSYCQLLWKTIRGETWGIIFCSTVINSARKQIRLSFSCLSQGLVPIPGCTSGRGVLCPPFPLGMVGCLCLPRLRQYHPPWFFFSTLYWCLAQPSDLIIFPSKPGNILVPEGQFKPTFCCKAFVHFQSWSVQIANGSKFSVLLQGAFNIISAEFGTR